MQGEDEWALVSAESGHIVGNPPGELKAPQRGWQEGRKLSLLSNTVLFVIVAIRIPRSMQEGAFRMVSKGSPHSCRDKPRRSQSLKGARSDLCGWRSTGGKAKLRGHP